MARSVQSNDAVQVGVLLKADKLLSMLAENPSGLGLIEISERSGINKGTCRRLLATLQTLGYVHQKKLYGNYTLGLRSVELGSVVERHLDVRREALPYLRDLGQRTEESVFLFTRRGDKALCAVIIEGKQVSIRVHLGDSIPLYLGSAPRCLLASRPDSEIETILSQPLWVPTERSPRTAEEIWQLIRHCRQHGYNLAREELHLGFIAIGAPIFDADGRTVAAVSLSGVVPRIGGDRQPELVRLLKETTQRISRRLGFRGE